MNTEKRKNARMVSLLDPEMAAKHNIHLAYVLVECGCGRTFGVSPDELNQVSEEKLICFSCLVKKHGLVDSEI